MLTTTEFLNPDSLRNIITNAYRMDETTCLHTLIAYALLPEANRLHMAEIAKQLMITTREYKKKQSRLDTLLHQYDLSTDEGIALMCMAEALLRIPDTDTIDKFISDKIATAAWQTHLSKDNPFFINAATWSLIISGKIYTPTLNAQQDLMNSLKRAISRLGVVMVRPIIFQLMRVIGKQFVMGETIEAAIKRAQKLEKIGYRFSYDMLGEAARTQEDALHYFAAYEHAISALGQSALFKDPFQNPGISIKLSALNPRYEFTQYERLLKELPPLLLTLAKQAKEYNIGLVVDAEEADRLDLSLDIFEQVFSDPILADWEGFGLAVQAYQKRAFYVLDWLTELSRKHKKRLLVRLVKGAYWDAEIKMSQVQGLSNYPVFTRKNSTDISYQACARKMLAQPECFYSQFGTHNAYSVAAILEMADKKSLFEFQCLHGMGRPLYDQMINPNQFNVPCRIYAPVGTHKDLLGYLVRRLLENGANSSFVNKLADDKTPIEKIIVDPIMRIANLPRKPHPLIPLPKNIYQHWENSEGIDLSNTHDLQTLNEGLKEASQKEFFAASIVEGKICQDQITQQIVSPSNRDHIVGLAFPANFERIEQALQTAKKASLWGEQPVQKRTCVMENAAKLLQAEMPVLIYLICKEGGRTVPDAIAEVREAIDYCRYYAYRAREDFAPRELPGPTGETNRLYLYPRGVFVCISPWNFPAAIFTGQIVAALVAGNAVIAKPAEQTPLVAFKIVQLLHQAGVPKHALQLLIGKGSVVGTRLVSDERVAGVIFTGSTETAKSIENALAKRNGPIATFIAETGGQNAMIVDSSALAEQTVIDIVQSAFNSAGQRCSALRVLFVQEEMAEKLITMLRGYMHELNIGDPLLLSTDVGPVINEEAQKMLMAHFAAMQKAGKLIAQAPLNKDPNGNYFVPQAFELENLNPLTHEVFGPILHVIRYQKDKLNDVLNTIIDTGYGLTFGIHSRIDSKIKSIAGRMPVGNIYVNRNMIGAVVGVQPFGGERLSGTGPKAGGPYYLPRLCIERTVSENTTALGGNARLVSLIEDDE